MTWPPGTPGQDAASLRADLAAQGGWTPVLERFGLAVWRHGSHGPPATLLPRGGVLVGELFDRAATEAGEVAPYDPRRLADEDWLVVARRVVREAWGRYVLVLPVSGRAPVIIRDPLGAIDALAWRRGDVHLVGDLVPRGLAAPPDLALDLPRLSALIGEPDLATDDPPLTGLVAVRPGTATDDQGRRHVLWTPGPFARRDDLTREAASDAIPRVTRACIAALTSGRERILGEVSGGLDSAIVATTLSALGQRPARGVHFYWPQAEADERPYAKAVAKAAGIGLDLIARPIEPIDPAAFEAVAHAPRPSFNAVDPLYDARLAERLVAHQAQALITGQGGDVVFFQMPAPQLALDIAWRGPRRRGLSALSRRTQRSVWSLLAAGLGRPERMTFPFAVGAAPPPPHPWLTDLAGVGAAKRIQIEGLIANQASLALSRRGSVADLLHPLLSQPLVELCLRTPAAILAGGEQDRAFTRGLFQGQLPQAVFRRQAKGDLSVYFAKSVSLSLPAWRPYLLEGELARLGLIDVDRLDAAMTPETMIWRDGSAEILSLMVLETWTRHWQGRIADGRRDLNSAPADPGARAGS